MAGQYMRTMFVSHGNFVIASVIPVILCAPKYLAGEMTLGTVMQAAAAFIQVQYAFNWIVDNYPRLAEWTASARRASNLLVAIDGLDHVEDSQIGAISRTEGEGAAIRLRDVSVALSDGTVVVDDADVTVQFGEKVLVAGESGTGKSTLVRAIAGLWPWGEGEITLKRGAKMFLMPQKPYIPLGTLRRATTYPRAAGGLRRQGDRRDARNGRPRTSHREARRRGRRNGTARCRAASSSASPSRGCSCTSPTSS